jgi:hypothetical protein
MKPLTLIKDEAAPALRQPVSLAPVPAAPWPITCAPVVAHGRFASQFRQLNNILSLHMFGLPAFGSHR